MKALKIFTTLLTVGILIAAGAARADTHNWDGSSSGWWDDGANWTSNTAPTAGDDLFFGTSVSNYANYDNLPAMNAVGTVTFSGNIYNITANGGPSWLGFSQITNNSALTNYLYVPLKLNNYWGGTITNNGTLTLGAINTDGPNYDTLTFDSYGPTVVSGVISGPGDVVKKNVGTLTLQASNTYGGYTGIESGVLKLEGAGSVPDTSRLILYTNTLFNLNNVSDTVGSIEDHGNISLGSATLTVGGNNSSRDYYGVISGTGGLTKVGSGRLTLCSANTYTGVTRVSGGTLTLGNWTFTAPSNGYLSNSSDLIVESGGLIDGDGNYTETVASLSGSGRLELGGAGTLCINAGSSGASTTFSGVIANRPGPVGLPWLGGAGALTKSGGGTMTLTGLNTYTGATTVSGGVLRYGAANVLSDATDVTVNSATLDLAGYSDTIGSLSGNSGGYVTLGTGRLVAGASNANTTYNGIISGASGHFEKVGIGALTLTNASGYTGEMTVTAGTLVGAAATLPGAIVTNSRLMFNQTGAGTYGGRISGSGILEKGGGSTLMLSGSNSNTGGTVISAGGLVVGGAGLLGPGAVINNGSLSFERDTFTVSSAISGSGTLTQAGGSYSSTILTGANTYTGTTTVTAGTLQVGNGGSTGSLGSGSVTNNATLLFNRSDTYVVPNVVSGVGTLVKAGSGTMTITGAGTYSGATSVQAGTIRLEAGGSVSNTSNVSLSSGAVFDMNGYSDTVGNILGYGDITLGAGRLTVGGNNTANEYYGTISGTGGLTRMGAGETTLRGHNTYTGTTNINGGTLTLGVWTVDAPEGGFLSDSTAVVMTGGLLLGRSSSVSGEMIETIGSLAGSGTVRMGCPWTSWYLRTGGNNTDTVFSGLISDTNFGNVDGAGGIIKEGSGTFTLSASNSYTLATIINAGTLRYGTNNVIYTGPVNVAGGVLDMQGYSDGVGKVTLSSGTIVGSGTLTATEYAMEDGTANVRLVGSNVPLTKSTAGTVVLLGSNTYSAWTNVKEGTLSVSGANGAIVSTANVDIHTGGVLALDNSTNNVGTRLNNSAPVTLYGGTLLLAGNPGAATTEAIGNLNQHTGHSTVKLTNGSSTTTLTAPLLNNSSNYGVVDFTGTGIGSTSKIMFTAVPTMDDGILRYAIVDGADFATYDPIDGIKAYAGYGSAISGSGDTVNVKRNANETLSSSGDINSLVINNAAVAGNAGTNLNVRTGSILTTGNTSISVPTLSFNAPARIISQGNTTVSSDITGSNVFTKLGTGTLTLTGTSSLTGQTHISSGVMKVNGSIASSQTYIEDGGTLSGSGKVGSLTVYEGGTVAPGNSPGILTVEGNSTWDDGGRYQWEVSNATGSSGVDYDWLNIAGTLELYYVSPANPFVIDIASLAGSNAGPCANFSSDQNYSWTIATAAGGILNFHSTRFTVDTSRFNNSFSGDFEVDASANNLFLKYVGVPFVGEGVWDAGGGVNTNWSESANWAGDMVAAPGIDVQMTAGAAMTVDGARRAGSITIVSPESSVAIDGGGALTVDSGIIKNTAAEVEISAPIILGFDQTWSNNNAAGVMTLSGTIDNAGNGLTLGGVGDIVVDNVISGDGELVMNGSGLLTVNTAQAYRGGTTVNGGTLRYGADNTLFVQDKITVGLSGTLDLHGHNATAASIEGSGRVVLGDGTLTAGSGVNANFSGTISGAGALTKTGAASMNLLGNNTYTGATTIAAGTLYGGVANALSDSTAVTVQSGATYMLGNGCSDTVGSLSGAGTVQINGTSSRTTLTVGGDDTSTAYAGVIQTSSPSYYQYFTKEGAGVLTLSGPANSIKNIWITAAEGTVRLETAGIIDPSQPSYVTVAQGAVFDLNGHSNSVGSLSGAGSVTLGTATMSAT
ncbi:MAG TPA: autotransporter-associated beta strand repeat-containing protein, partial [bacterium]|nr:autotransporter-associated beta strand repeat-containing protein [bacterium]